MDVKTYEAAVINALINGKTLPSIKEVVLSKLSKSPIKLEDLVREVGDQTCIDGDDLKGKVSSILKKFRDEGIAAQGVMHGDWMLK